MVKNMLRLVGRFLRAREAVSALEYAVLVGVVIAGIGGALAAFSGNLTEAVEEIGQTVTDGLDTLEEADLAAEDEG